MIIRYQLKKNIIVVNATWALQLTRVCKYNYTSVQLQLTQVCKYNYTSMQLQLTWVWKYNYTRV